MSILAGLFTRSSALRPDDATCEALAAVVSRREDDERAVFRDDRLFLVKVDIGAHRERAFRRDAAGGVAALAGEPLIAAPGDTRAGTRDADLAAIAEAVEAGRADAVLAGTQGVFCAAHYRPRPATLTLIADKLGARSLYVYQGERHVIFSTAMRILLALPSVTRGMDLRGVTEIASFGFALGRRTAFRDISLLGAGEVLTVSDAGVASRQYWRWDAMRTSQEPEGSFLAEAYRRFTTSVARRSRDDTRTVSFLSGGLDSRCIVASLRERGLTVHTVNFAPPGTQDQAFAAAFAEAAGVVHEEFGGERELDNPFDWLGNTGAAWIASGRRRGFGLERPDLVWTGNGGSVGVGHAYMHEPVIVLMRQGKRDDAIRAFLRRQRANVVRRLLHPAVREEIVGALHKGIAEELDASVSDDPARAFHLFLMHNDQRRHMADHWENIDLVRFDQHVPFMDGHFLEWMLSAPIDRCFGHRLYHRWLSTFPPAVASVPWQAYPGHEQCPLPVPPGLGYQWSQAYSPYRINDLRKRQRLAQARKLLRSDHFPGHLLDRRYLRLATWVYRTGFRDYGYVVGAAQTFQRYWALSQGASPATVGRAAAMGPAAR
jgi:asparagine synthase (glutamine-hydrolysing)